MIDIYVTFTDDSVPGIDLVVPDPDFIIQKKNLKGIVLTHGHEDHIEQLLALALLKVQNFLPSFPLLQSIKENLRKRKLI